MAYNIKEGFAKKDKKELYVYEPKREKLAKTLIEQENPDIIVLTEACWLQETQSKIRKNYSKIFKYKYYAYGNDLGKDTDRDIDWGISVLSKYPIVKWENFCIKHTRWIRAWIKIGKKTLMLDAVHPDPSHREFQRKQCFKTIIRDMQKPYIIAGDFNAFSHQDTYNKNRLIKGFRESFKPEEKHKARELVNSILTSQVTRLLVNSGLKDTYKVKNKKFDYTYHTKLSRNKYDHSRIDYIFCSKDIKIIDAGIIKNELVEEASDHYPIYSDLKI